MSRPWLLERMCGDPNPHMAHKWDRYLDPYADYADPRFWCKGIENVPVKGELLGEEPEQRYPPAVVIGVPWWEED